MTSLSSGKGPSLSLRVNVKEARALNTNELRACYAMSFRAFGDLNEWLYQARHWDEYKATKAILVEEDGVILGWGLRRPDGNVGFWTRRSARGRGIGKKMVQRAARMGDITVHPHDQASRALFRKVGLTLKARNYNVYDKDMDFLKRLREEYETIGRDCSIERSKVVGEPHKLTVFAYTTKDRKPERQDKKAKRR